MKYDELANAVIDRIGERMEKSPLIMSMMSAFHNPDKRGYDPLTATAADEHLDAITREEIAAALNGNYELANEVMIKMARRFRAYLNTATEEDHREGKVAHMNRVVTIQEIARGLEQNTKEESDE